MYIPESEVRTLLTYEALIPALRQALIDYSAGRVEQPARTILRAGNAEGDLNGWFAIMPVLHGDAMGVKTVTFYPGNAALGLPTHMAVVELLRRATGEPLAVMDGRLITEMRTAAVSAVALDALAPASVASLGIFGSGVQARSHLQALRRVRPSLTDIRICSRTQAHASQLAEECGGQATRPEDAAAADVVLTVTSSPTPVLEGRWLSRRAVVLAVGATGGTLRELDDEVLRSSFVVAECRTAATREAGDIALGAEIGQILAGEIAPPPGRRVFKSVGMAIEDLTAARLVWQAQSSVSR
jgi:thiomorpholine-carboxylate dehydrogenase